MTLTPAGAVHGGPARRELLLTAATTAAVAAFILVLDPNPGDEPAHLYRTFLVDHGVMLWDNLWYAGQYPLTSYSLLYYFPAALVGNLPLVIAASVATSVLFGLISYREWGPTARWPTRVFCVCAAAPLFTGLYAYTLGFATLLAALHLLQRQRTWLVVVCALLTLGFSPLAFGFLCLNLSAIAATRRSHSVRTVLLAVALLAIGLFEFADLVLFPTPGSYPFNPVDLAAVLGVSVLGAALARQSGASRLIAVFFVLWALGSAFFYLVPTAIGDNWTRLREFVFPLMLVAAIQARFRPRPLVVGALAAALAYNLVPYLMLIPYRLDSGPGSAAFWRPAIQFLDANARRPLRVEVVPTAAHWESYWIPHADIALARGWFRQLDEATNPVLYAPGLNGRTYDAWLHRMGIQFVLLPATELDPLGGPAEARLLRSPSSPLVEVFHDRTWTIYRVPHPTPLLTGPSPARLIAVSHQLIEGWVAAPGSYFLRFHYMPYWSARPAGTCVGPGSNGMTELALARRGRFTLRVPDSLLGSLDAVLTAITRTPPACAPASG